MSVKIYPESTWVKSGLFPGGEVNVHLEGDIWIDTKLKKFSILCHCHNSNDIMELLMVTDALRQSFQRPEIHLILPYLPYARQDAIRNSGESLSVRVMADLINAQKYESVQVWDAHSPVAPALLDRVENIGLEILAAPVRWFLKNETPPIMVAPDAGSLKKVGALAKHWGAPLVRADKTRDTTTGEISGSVVYTDHVGDTPFLVVDDICDGGWTFLELGKALREKTRGKLYLYVTHGIFSKGFDELLKVYERIFVSNPWPRILPERVTQLDHSYLYVYEP